MAKGTHREQIRPEMDSEIIINLETIIIVSTAKGHKT